MADIKTVVTYESGDIITLSKPKMVIQSQEGFGFAKGVCVTSVESPDEVDFRKSNVVFSIDTHEDVKKAYEEATSVIERV